MPSRWKRPTQPYPLVKQLEIKAVFAAVFVNADKLVRKPFAADSRIKRQGENGGDYHILTVLACRAHIAFDDFKMPLRPYPDIIIARKRVAMEPLRVDKRLRGKCGVDNLDGQRVFYNSKTEFFTVEANRELVLARSKVLGHCQINPNAAERFRNGSRAAAVKRTE